MSENWKIQVSPRVGDTLINLRADTPSEAESILAWATANASTIADTVKAFGAVVNVNAAVPGSAVVAQSGPAWSQQGSQQTYQNQQPPQQGKQCVHGPRVRREGTNKNGGAYVAHFCPTPKGSPGQCAPEFE